MKQDGASTVLPSSDSVARTTKKNKCWVLKPNMRCDRKKHNNLSELWPFLLKAATWEFTQCENAKEEVKLWGRSQCHVFVAMYQKGEVSSRAMSLRVSVRVCIHRFCTLSHFSHPETVWQKNKDIDKFPCSFVSINSFSHVTRGRYFKLAVAAGLLDWRECRSGG